MNKTLLRQISDQVMLAGKKLIPCALILLILPNLFTPLWGAEATPERVEQARESGYWEVREGETLLSIAGHLMPDRPDLHQDFIRDVTELNFEIFGGVQPDLFRPGIRIKLPDYTVTEPVIARRLEAARAKELAESEEVQTPAAATKPEKAPVPVPPVVTEKSEAVPKTAVPAVADKPEKAPESVAPAVTPRAPATKAVDSAKATEADNPRVVQARAEGRITTRPGENVFSLARLFFPKRANAQQLFTQSLIQLNTEVFDTIEINAIPAGTVLQLPGYVWNEKQQAPPAKEIDIRSRPTPSAETSVPVPVKVDEETTAVTEGSISPQAPLAEESKQQTQAVAESDSYADQYLSDDPDYVDRQVEEEEDQKPGRRTLEVTGHYYQNSDDFLGDETESGINTHWRRETLNFGEIDVDASLSNFDFNRLNQTSDGTDLLLTMRQTDMPLSSTHYLNTTLGHQRTVVSPFLQGGYRFRLPSSPLLGLSGEINSQLENVHWFLGNTGSYQGFALRQFEEDDGQLLGAAYERQLTPQWRLGGKVVSLQDHQEIVDHSSVLLAGRYEVDTANHELHLLADDDGNTGAWSDSLNQFGGGFSARYGVFYIAPELAWTDAAVANDQMGLYTRLDRRGYRHDFALGYDYYETGLDGELVESDNHSIYFNNNYRLNKSLTLGTSSNLAQRVFRSDTEDTQDSWRLQGFLYQRMRLGTSRYELFASELDSDNESNHREEQGFRWSHDWRTPRRYRLTTEFSVENDKQFDDQQQQISIGTIFRQDVSETFNWSVHASLLRTDSDLSGNRDGASINASTRWDFMPNWFAALSVNYNQSSTTAAVTEFVTMDEEIQSDGVWLTLGYAKSSGRAYPKFGNGASRNGSGNIFGTVFYDDNRDGIQQPGERTASGVILILDGRYEARTDRQGRYSYQPVPAGQHHVRLMVEDLPLPWGLDNESPRMVSVGVRQNEELNFPLIRTDQ